MVKSHEIWFCNFDMAVEQGGNVIGSKLNENSSNINGVTIIGEGNIPSLLPMNASDLYAKIFKLSYII
jgi:NAD(P) transhydrogenase subunit alpha